MQNVEGSMQNDAVEWLLTLTLALTLTRIKFLQRPFRILLSVFRILHIANTQHRRR